MNEIQKIRAAIVSGVFTNDDLNSLIEAIKYARAQLTHQTNRKLKVGDVVKFTSNRNGRTYTGTVDKIKIKYVLVQTPQGRYNVPGNMLEAV